MERRSKTGTLSSTLYAADNGIEILSGLDIDDQFSFDAAGQQATDPINVDSEFGCWARLGTRVDLL